MSKPLYVRIALAQKNVDRFFRCGVEFTKDWTMLNDVDSATAQRLEEEQMLEVSETAPVEKDGEAQSGDSAAAQSSKAPAVVADTPALALVVEPVPEPVAEPAEAPAEAPEPAPAEESVAPKPAGSIAVLAAVKAAISQLDKSDAALFTASGKPKTEAIAAITGWPVSAAERDAALVAEGA